MRGLLFELTVGTHFVGRGFSVNWPEMCETGRFDMLVSREPGFDVEIECKSFAVDKGLKVPRRDAVEFRHRVNRALKGLSPRAGRGVGLVLTVANRLPSKHEDRQKLVDLVKRAYMTTLEQEDDKGSICKTVDFDPDVLDRACRSNNQRAVRREVDRITNTVNREAAIDGDVNKGLRLLVTQSRQDDDVQEAMYGELKGGAKQLTGSKPGFVVAELSAFDSEKLLQVSTVTDKEVLSQVADHLLESSQRHHLAGVAFWSRSAAFVEDETARTIGSTYVLFKNRNSPIWRPELEEFFDKRTPIP